MIDAGRLRADPGLVCAALKRRGHALDIGKFQSIDEELRRLRTKNETIRARRNSLSKRIGEVVRDGGDAELVAGLKAQSAVAGEHLAELDKVLRDLIKSERRFLLGIPNVPNSTVPDGTDESCNVEIRRHGEPQQFAFQPLDHTELGSLHLGIDLRSAGNIARSRFAVLSGSFAKLHRVLAQFMVDLHVSEHGYVEKYVPFLANGAAMVASGQLPKFADQIFSISGDDLHLIPTAEVPLVNLVAGMLVPRAELPMKFVAHTPSFRREAGSYGRDTRGILRQHQFDKVELVQVTDPESSYVALEEIVDQAEKVLRLLEIPFRTVNLCAGDLGEAAAKTYDIEAWMPGQGTYREISSCSNTEDYQARRLGARLTAETGKGSRLVHILNGSGLAVGRTMIALVENHQNEDGSITVPVALRPFMGGLERLVPPGK